MLSSKHGKSKRCSTRLRKTGTAALARRGAVAAGRSSGGSGAAGGRASAIRESLGPATGRGRTKGAAEGRARRAQVRLKTADLRRIERGLQRGPEALGY